MTNEQRQAIEKHGRQLLAIFPEALEKDPVKLCKRLRRLETQADRWNVAYCNGDIDTEGHTKRTERIIDRAIELLLPVDRGIRFNSDPRGYALKVDLQNGERLHTDWGGYGIIAPEIGPEGA